MDTIMRRPLNASLALALTTILLALSSCASPEQQLHDRQVKLERFAQGVVKHLLDRDPKMYRESVAALVREELDDNTIDKLQSMGKLPEPGLEEMKVVSDAQDNKTTNTVETTDIKPVGPVQNDVVPIKVVGKVINYRNGVKTIEQPFSLEVDCKLTAAMTGYPRVVGIRGLENLAAMSIRPTDLSGKTIQPGQLHKRRVRRSS